MNELERICMRIERYVMSAILVGWFVLFIWTLIKG